jgi:hypothetical protein
VTDLVRGSRIGRLGWSVVDQALVSLTGAAVTVQGAASLAPVEFGRLSAVLAGYYFLLTGLRAVVGEVYLVRFAGAPDRLPLGTPRWAQLTTLTLSGAVAAGLLGAVAAPLPASTRQILAALAIALPLLLWQEIRRAILLAAARPARSAASSALVLAGQGTGGLVLRLADRVSGPGLLLCWAAGAALAIGCVPVADWRRVPGRAGAWRWLAEGRAYWPRFLCQDMSQGGASQAALLLVAGAAGTLVVAGVRTALLLLAPLIMLQQAAAYFAMAEATRVRPAGHWRFVVVCQAGAITAGAAWLAALALVPRSALGVLVGENLAAGLDALPGMALFAVGTLLLAAPVAALRGAGHVQAGMALGVALMPVLLAAPTLIAIRGGTAAEVAGAFGAFGVLSAVAWTVACATLLRPRRVPRAAHAG